MIGGETFLLRIYIGSIDMNKNDKKNLIRNTEQVIEKDKYES